MRITPQKIYSEYDKGTQYNNNINLYETVKRNENFFIGKQWEGLKAPDLDTPTLPFLKRVVSYFISQLVSDDIAVQFDPWLDIQQAKMACAILKSEVDRVIEDTKAKSKARDMLRNCAVDGDGCFYFYYDVESEDIAVELTDNTKVLFGNPYNNDVQTQDRIIVVQRVTLEKAKKIAEQNGISDEDIENIRPDNENFIDENGDYDDELVTIFTRFWKEKGTIHFAQCTKDVMLKEDTDTLYKLYPIAWINWEKIKNSYHGQSCITGLIPNQIYVNKIVAMAMLHTKMTAFPKIVYDKSKLPGGWDNTVGQAIGVVGNVSDVVMQATRPAEMSHQALALVDKVIEYSKELMGASDAALGDIKPENTSAIIATQKASAMPLELQKQAYYQFWEDCVRIMLEIMRVNFGTREVAADLYDVTGEEGKQVIQFNFDAQDYKRMKLDVKVGASSYWSEIAQTQTADTMLINKVITDPITYLEAIPDSVVKDKAKILARLRSQQKAQMQMAAQPVEAAGVEPFSEMGLSPNHINATGEDWLNTKIATVDRMDGDSL